MKQDSAAKPRRDLAAHDAQDALPLCASTQCDVTGKFQQSINAAKALCVALRLEHAYLLQVRSASVQAPS